MREKHFGSLQLWFAIVVVGICVALPARAAQRGLYGESLCDTPGYHCITAGTSVVEKTVRTRKGKTVIKKKVRDTWENLWPDPREREIVIKLNRMNLRLRKGMVVAVPDDMAGKTYMDYSPFPLRLEPVCAPKGEPVCRLRCDNCGSGQEKVKRVCEQECDPAQKLAFGPDGELHGEKLIIFDPKLLAFAAYDEQGRLVRWGPAAGGRSWCPDIGKRCLTVTGEFKVNSKEGRWASSSQFPVAKDDEPAGGAPTPYFLSFTRGFGIHASTDVPGRNASHGCVRIFFEDAKWLNLEFADIGTRVVVEPYD
ncbi:MAG TPA: L,D-transpeptidase [bacterium]|nr:L,D-transpeptidase [bacterium]